MKVCGVYEIRSISCPDKIYIGSSLDVYKRMNVHRTSLIHGRHYNSKLQAHRDEYGSYDLVYTVLFCCNECGLTPLEQFLINYYKPYFNISKFSKDRGDRSAQIEAGKKSLLNKNRVVSLETRYLLSIRARMQWERPGMREKMSVLISVGRRYGRLNAIRATYGGMGMTEEQINEEIKKWHTS